MAILTILILQEQEDGRHFFTFKKESRTMKPVEIVLRKGRGDESS
jgi:hypothetical protein